MNSTHTTSPETQNAALDLIKANGESVTAKGLSEQLTNQYSIDCSVHRASAILQAFATDGLLRRASEGTYSPVSADRRLSGDRVPVTAWREAMDRNPLIDSALEAAAP